MGDIDINVNANDISSHDYLHMLHLNTFINLITKTTRKTPTSQTTIDHIITNDSKSKITPGVLTYSISDHCPVFCKILLP